MEDNIFAMDLEPACKHNSNANETVNDDSIDDDEVEKDNNEFNVDEDMEIEEERKDEKEFATVTRHGRKVKQRDFLDTSATNNYYQILSDMTDEDLTTILVVMEIALAPGLNALMS